MSSMARSRSDSCPDRSRAIPPARSPKSDRQRTMSSEMPNDSTRRSGITRQPTTLHPLSRMAGRCRCCSHRMRRRRGEWRPNGRAACQLILLSAMRSGHDARLRRCSAVAPGTPQPGQRGDRHAPARQFDELTSIHENLASDFRLPTSDFRLPTSDFDLPYPHHVSPVARWARTISGFNSIPSPGLSVT